MPNSETDLPIVTAAGIVYPEPCPAAEDIIAAGCRDAVRAALTPVAIPSLGRIVQVDATVKNVCPGKQVAVAILLSEVDAQGTEYPRGTKMLLLPAQLGEGCQDVTLRCVSFVVPEALDAAGSPDSLCNSRSFRARVLANYVDTDYVSCCDTDAVTL